jgi:hypothetical protein
LTEREKQTRRVCTPADASAWT